MNEIRPANKIFEMKLTSDGLCGVACCMKPRMRTSKGGGKHKTKRLCRAHFKALQRQRKENRIREGAQSLTPKP